MFEPQQRYVLTYKGRDIYLEPQQGDTKEFTDTLLEDLCRFIKKGRRITNENKNIGEEESVAVRGEDGVISRDEECVNILKNGFKITFSIKEL